MCDVSKSIQYVFSRAAFRHWHYDTIHINNSCWYVKINFAWKFSQTICFLSDRSLLPRLTLERRSVKEETAVLFMRFALHCIRVAVGKRPLCVWCKLARCRCRCSANALQCSDCGFTPPASCRNSGWCLVIKAWVSSFTWWHVNEDKQKEQKTPRQGGSVHLQSWTRAPGW